MELHDGIIGLFPVAYSESGYGWILGIIATIHMLASHVSVGAALISTWLATVAVRDNRPELFEYIRRYGVFLLVFSYVLGSITGPGIWFAATIVSPRPLSTLIHLNVFLWAVEWLFFVIEVIGVYLLVYLPSRVDKRTYLNIAWIFGAASLATLLVIVGILSFMMFPGQESWYSQGGTLRAFFSTYTFAQAFCRICFMLVSAALAGGLIAVGIEEKQFKIEMTKKLSVLGFVGATLGFIGFKYSLTTLPESVNHALKLYLPEYFEPSLWAILILTLGYVLVLRFRIDLLTKPIASVMLVLLLVLGIYPMERAREIIRKPYVVAQRVYPSGIIGGDISAFDIKSELGVFKNGILKQHPFFQHLSKISSKNQFEAGEALFLITCSSCHGAKDSGPRPLNQLFANNKNIEAIESFINGSLATCVMPIMPCMPFNKEEAYALALYIATNK